MKLLKRWIKALLGRAGYLLIKKREYDLGNYLIDGLYTLHNDHFRNDPAFQAAYARGVEAGCGVDPQFHWRVNTALWVAQAALRAPGNYVECGVNAGFMSSAIMQRLDWARIARRFYLIDTFSGPPLDQFSPAETAHDRRNLAEKAMAAGAYVTDLHRVRANFAEWPNAVVVQGVIPGVLATLDSGPVAFLHIDMNCAFPERAALEFFWDRLSPGAFVLLDDYAFTGHECQAAAIDEAARALGAQVLSLPTGQGLIIK